MPGLYRVLLVESDDTVLEMLQKNVRKHFPCIDLHTASTPDATMELLERNRYEIVICDAFLRHDRRVSFVAQMCQRADFFLIVITGDTEITADSFSPHIKEDCIHHVLYKPLDFKAFTSTLQCAILCVKARKAEAK